jgi:hypothetical protein
MYRNITLISKPTAGGYPLETEPITTALQLAFWIFKTIPKELFQPKLNVSYLSNIFPGTLICGLIIPVTITILFILLLTYVITSSQQRKALPGYIKKAYVPIFYIIIHLGGIVGLGAMIFLSNDPRYLATIYPFLLMTVTSFIFHVYRYIRKPTLKPFIFSLITVMCVFFLTIQAINFQDFYQDFKNGKGFNSSFWRNSDEIVWIKDNIPENAMVYSNNWWGISLRIDNPSGWLPFANEENTIDEFFESLENNEDSYIIGFKNLYLRGRNPQIMNEQIVEANQKHNVLTVVADFPEATIWHVKH